MKNNEIKKITFKVNYTLYVPFYYEDGEQDGYQEGEELHMEADSVTELAEKIDALEDIYALEVAAYDSTVDREIGFIGWIDDVDYSHCDSYDSICNSIASAVRYEKDFRGYAIIY